MTNPTNDHQQQNERCNIFRIIESADKELMHSSMIKFFLQSKLSKDIYDLFQIENIQELTIKLEESHTYETKYLKEGFVKATRNFGISNLPYDLDLDSNKKNHRIRFDIVGRREDEKKSMAFIIENKFKAIPTVHQLKMYDAAIECELGLPKNHNQYPKKILMILLRQQISKELDSYLSEYGWVAIPYLDESFNTSQSTDSINRLSLLSWLKDINSSPIDLDRRYIIKSYRERLEEFYYAINTLWKSQTIVTYNGPDNPITNINLDEENPEDTIKKLGIESRFLFLQYLISIQKSIDKKLNDNPNNINISYLLTNNGGSQVVPSVAFWHNVSQDAGANIPTLYFSIDGMTAKIGISFYRKKGDFIQNNLPNLRNFVFHRISQNKGFYFDSSYADENRNSKGFKPANDESTNGTSVYALFCFSIEGLEKDVFIEQSAKLVSHIFSKDTIIDFNESFNSKKNS